MTQVTDEMVRVAAQAIFDEEYKDIRRPRPDVEPQWKLYDASARAALKAALALRNSRRPSEICSKLREQAESTHSSGFITVSISYPICAEAADLIERQDEEIARHKEVICMLTAERAELIEALQPFIDPMQTLPSTNTMRARALLERLGAKE